MAKLDSTVLDVLATLCGMQCGIVPEEEELRFLQAQQLKELGPELVRQAVQHKVARLCLEALSRYGSCVPTGTAEELKKQVTADMPARMLLLREWRRVTETLISAGFPCLTLKGPASSLQFYNNVNTRGYNDLDLLVDAKNLQSLVPILMQAGYVPGEDQEISAVPRYLRFLYAELHHIAFYHRELPVCVEVHNHAWKKHALFFPVSTEELFRRAAEVEYEGHTFAALQPVDHTLYILAHGISHAWMLLHWLLDAAVILHSNDSRFLDEIKERARELKMERALTVTLMLVEQVFNVPAPTVFVPILEKNRDLVLPSLRHCLEAITTGGQNKATIRHILSHSLRHLALMTENPWVRFLLALRFFLATPADIRTLRLPVLFFPLYLILRIPLVLYRRAVRFFKTLGRERACAREDDAA